MIHLLVIDDDREILKMLELFFSSEGYHVLTGANGKEGFDLFQKRQVDIVFLDVNLPDLDGIEVLGRMMNVSRETPVIMITADGQIDTAVKAIKLGAFDYIQKPLNIKEMRLVAHKALKIAEMENEISLLKRREQRVAYENVVAVSPAMKVVLETIERVSQAPDATILITGESGTGKELVATAIHYRSERREKPFIAVNCNTLEEHLLESELFGHEKGAFTDAKTQKKGLIEMARGSTIFLDEIGDITLKLQGKLLRFLEDHSIRRVGGNCSIKVDVRVLAATNKNLEEKVKNGEFREDLYYRLRIVPIAIPPLRARKEDIIPLAISFIEDYNLRFDRMVSGITPEAIQALLQYVWPGNVRELKNVIERIFILLDFKEIERKHLPSEILQGVEPGAGGSATLMVQLNQSFQKVREEFEKKYLRHVLATHRGNISRSARAAGMTRSNFHRLINKYDITRDETAQ